MMVQDFSVQTDSEGVVHHWRVQINKVNSRGTDLQLTFHTAILEARTGSSKVRDLGSRSEEQEHDSPCKVAWSEPVFERRLMVWRVMEYKVIENEMKRGRGTRMRCFLERIQKEDA